MLTLAIHIDQGSVVIKQINITSFITHDRNSTITFKVDIKRKFLFSHMKVHEKQERTLLTVF